MERKDQAKTEKAATREARRERPWKKPTLLTDASILDFQPPDP